MERESASFATLTHARLRAAQGDVPGALRILGALLEAEPQNREAALLVGELADAEAVPEPTDERAAARPAVPGRAADLAPQFRRALEGSGAPGLDERRERLSAYLVKMVARRGARRDG